MHNVVRRPWLGALAIAVGLTGCVAKPTPVPREAGAECSEMAYKGFPRLEPLSKRTSFVCHKGFALEYDPSIKNAYWVVEHLTATNLDQRTASRDKEEFRPDAVLPKGMTPDPMWFSRTGYDRGHLAPADDFREDPASMSQSFYTSNVVAQNPDNNRGVWLRLEQNVRRWAQEKGELYVVTGPLFYNKQPLGWISMKDKKMQLIVPEYERKDKKKKKPPRNAIAVPTHMYKVIYSPSTNEAIAFIVPNMSVPETNLPRYATTVAQVESINSIRYFPQLDMAAQEALKVHYNAQAWVLK